LDCLGSELEPRGKLNGRLSQPQGLPMLLYPVVSGSRARRMALATSSVSLIDACLGTASSRLVPYQGAEAGGSRLWDCLCLLVSPSVMPTVVRE
jgi:hypothetical protein